MFVIDKSPRTPKQSPRQRKTKRTAGFDDWTEYLCIYYI